MTPRFSHALLIVSVLLNLAACGTRMAKQDDPSSGQPFYPDDSMALEQRQLETQRRDATMSLEEAAELSAGMKDYQPFQAMEIIRTLDSVPSNYLTTLIDQQHHDPEFTEWLELALQIRTVAISATPDSVAAREWVKYHYAHKVTQNDFSELVHHYRAGFKPPARVAVLLPAHGRLSAAARAIRDGIMSAYLDRPGDSVIRFYSSGQDSEAAIAAYQHARYDGAQHIIGPLDIDSTRTIANLANLTIPVLLLNEGSQVDRADESEPIEDEFMGAGRHERYTGVVNSLSLSTTEEALAIAAKALARGQFNAIMIIPDDGWGARVATAFQAAFESGGGQIVASARFNSNENDHSSVLTQLLKIDESRQRKSELQSWLGVPLTFEPVRRYDFDFIFLAANPTEGREIKPLLRFHDTGDVPVYAMGRIFNGRQQNTANQDLNGIIFPSTHWQLQVPGNSDNLPASIRGGVYGNLYALGMDAWHLLSWLPLMQKDPDLWFHGKVGSLRRQSNGRFEREPAWAQFTSGQPFEFTWPHTDEAKTNQ